MERYDPKRNLRGFKFMGDISGLLLLRKGWYLESDSWAACVGDSGEPEPKLLNAGAALYQ